MTPETPAAASLARGSDAAPGSSQPQGGRVAMTEQQIRDWLAIIQREADPSHWLACAVKRELWPGEVDEARAAVRRGR